MKKGLILGGVISLAIWAGLYLIIAHAASVLAPHSVTPIAPSVHLVNRSQPVRLVYGHSIVAGGIATLAEAVQAYPALDMTRAHFAMLPVQTCASVSYQNNGRVFWTRAKHCYPAGTLIITDGKIVILARCGNQIGIAPPRTTEALPPNDLDTPVGAVPYAPPNEVATPIGDLLLPPVITETLFITPPIVTDTIPPVTPTCCTLVVMPPFTPSTPISAPEPDSGLMLLIGLASVIISLSAMKRRKEGSRDKNNR
jgi:hypothetical protein